MPTSTFHNKRKRSLKIACLGDSTTELSGGWPNYLKTLASTWNARCGMIGIWHDEWSATGTWTQPTGTDAWDVGPFTTGAFNSGVAKANGSANIATFTPPAGMTGMIRLYIVDGTGSGNFSYSTDGGTTWLALNLFAWNNNNSIVQMDIPNVTSTLKVRAATDTGVAVNLYVMGAEPLVGTDSCAIHNIAASGESLYSAVRSNSGDWTKWYDLVLPDIVTVMFTNDVLLWNRTGYEANLQSIIDTVQGNGGEVILMAFGEQNNRSVTDQADLRAAVVSKATANSINYINFYDYWGNYATANASGYMNGDVHPSASGMSFMADKVWRLVARATTGKKLRVP